MLSIAESERIVTELILVILPLNEPTGYFGVCGKISRELGSQGAFKDQTVVYDGKLIVEWEKQESFVVDSSATQHRIRSRPF